MISILARINRLPLAKIPVSLNGMYFTAASFDRLLSLLLHKFGLMGTNEIRTIRRLVRPGMQTLDIGGNQGLYSLLLSSLVGPQGKVHAFEPDPHLFRSLSLNIERNALTNIRAHNVAIGATEGELPLRCDPFNSGNNQIGTKRPGGSVLRVPVRPIDRLFPEGRVDFIKLDIQGWELEALTGMQGLLARSPEVVILIEYWPQGLREAGQDPIGIKHFFSDRGFEVWHKKNDSPLEPFDFERYITKAKPSDYVDLIACRQPIRFS